MKSFNKIIWAADPLESKDTLDQSMNVLRDLSKRTGATIEPVYVLSDGLLSLSLPKSQLVKEFKPASEKALSVIAKKAKFTKLAAPTVLVSAPSSRSSAAEALDRYARSQKADLILVNSHGRQGLKRVVMGSFAETLTLHSKTPILITGPKTKRISKLDHILFPTDFSIHSKRAFEKVLQLADKLGAKVTLFSVILNPYDPFVQSGVGLLGGGFVTTQGYIKPNYDREQKLATLWVAEGRKKGIAVDTAFEVDSTSVTLSVLKYAAKKKVGMIAMASQSGAVSAAILGSVGRGVAREAPCPVWFLRA